MRKVTWHERLDDWKWITVIGSCFIVLFLIVAAGCVGYIMWWALVNTMVVFVKLFVFATYGRTQRWTPIRWQKKKGPPDLAGDWQNIWSLLPIGRPMVAPFLMLGKGRIEKDLYLLMIALRLFPIGGVHYVREHDEGHFYRIQCLPEAIWKAISKAAWNGNMDEVAEVIESVGEIDWWKSNTKLCKLLWTVSKLGGPARGIWSLHTLWYLFVVGSSLRDADRAA